MEKYATQKHPKVRWWWPVHFRPVILAVFGEDPSFIEKARIPASANNFRGQAQQLAGMTANWQ